MTEKQELRVSSSIVSDPKSMSQFFYDFIQKNHGNSLMAEGMGIPKNIVQYWDDSLRIPEEVRTCMTSWEGLEVNGYRVMRFDYDAASDFIRDRFTLEYLQAFEGCPSPAMRAEFFSLCFLYIYGGIYVASDESLIDTDFDSLTLGNALKVQALSYKFKQEASIELTDGMIREGFREDDLIYIDKSPILAPANHKVIGMLLEAAIELIRLRMVTSDMESLIGPEAISKAIVAYLADAKGTYVADTITTIAEWSKHSMTTKVNPKADQWLKHFTRMAADPI